MQLGKTKTNRKTNAAKKPGFHFRAVSQNIPDCLSGKKALVHLHALWGLNEWYCEGRGGLGLCHSLIHSATFLKEAATVGFSGLTYMRTQAWSVYMQHAGKAPGGSLRLRLLW